MARQAELSMRRAADRRAIRGRGQTAAVAWLAALKSTGDLSRFFDPHWILRAAGPAWYRLRNAAEPGTVLVDDDTLGEELFTLGFLQLCAQAQSEVRAEQEARAEIDLAEAERVDRMAAEERAHEAAQLRAELRQPVPAVGPDDLPFA